MLSRPHVTKQYEYFRTYRQAHQEIIDKLQALTDMCFSMDSKNNPAETYRQLHQELSDMFEAHDRAFDDPFIQSTKT